MRCQRCQHESRLTARFCDACGTELAGAEPSGSASAPASSGDWLASLGRAALDRGDRQAARAWFEESLTLALAVPGSDRVPRLLEAFAGLAAAGRDYARALTLAGAAATVRDVTGPSASGDVEGTLKWLGRAHDCLGEPAARAAWRRGRRMSFEEAVEYALATIVPS
jgi:hypothetical protein